MSFLANLEPTMRTTINLDDDLLAKASMLTGITDRTPLIRESLKAIIARESARRLALLGGSMPELELTPRRRPEPDPEFDSPV
jgi:Arc/MetJ family transcription regulator